MHNLLITWNDTHAIGVPILDEQHRGIVAEMNSLFFILFMDGNYDYIAPMVEILQLKTALHFSLEEELMGRAGFSGFIRHREQHRALTEEFHSVAALDRIIAEPVAFLEHLKRWWLDHINQDDRECADSIHGYLLQNAL